MSDFDVELDTCGLNCPLPVIKARKALNEMTVGQSLRLICTDRGALKDIPAFCKITQNPLIDSSEADDKLFFTIQKGA